MLRSMSSIPALLLGLTLGLVDTAQPQISAADFMPPARGGTSEVTGAVSESKDAAIGETVIMAQTPQDAFNAAIQQEREGLVRFGSGYGFVASGVAVYQSFPNPDATLISKRLAYVKAYEAAKKNLNQTLRGYSNKQMSALREETISETTADETRTQMTTDYESSVEQFVEGLLRGFVVYEISEDESEHMVNISIVTTPKTRSVLSRQNRAVVEAETLLEGMEETLQEIKSGIVAPVGGRVIKVKNTNEMALVGYGSEIVRHSDNPAIRARMKVVAMNAALMNASSSLCGLLQGEMLLWTGSMTDNTKEKYKDFAGVVGDDALADEGSELDVEDIRSSFVNEFRLTDEYKSATEGKIPPGTTKKQWMSQDGNWAYCVAVYSPSMENIAGEALRDMNQPGSQRGRGADSGPRTGRIHNDDDL